jgi:CheY-like chemotaxis protein
MRKLRALIVDDVVDMAQTIANDLEAAGYESEVASGGASALERRARPADVVTTDLRMRNVDGLTYRRQRAPPGVPVVT